MYFYLGMKRRSRGRHTSGGLIEGKRLRCNTSAALHHDIVRLQSEATTIEETRMIYLMHMARIER